MSLWNESYATGNEIVDNDHKEVFKLVQDVLSSSKLDRTDKVGKAINFLSYYVVNHFNNEEKLMDECTYPDAAAHKEEHRAFLEVATAMKEKFDNNGYSLGEFTDDNNLSLSMEINKNVVTWLSKHIMDSDRKLAEYYRDWSEKA
ncbi:MAG: hemerythrin family protein [Defluviitaleaceae bacterium]|nr:hemerythrin family protein [Defluviitaleaceae bacterium]